MSKHLIILLLVVTTGILTGFDTKKFKYLKNSPPGTIQIDKNFYVDQSEVKNQDYLEYMFWMSRVYGKNSKQYNSTLPDTSVWKAHQKDKEGKFCEGHSLVETYLHHPAYRTYPLVGVSQEQAKAYCQWRSDRVFEFILIQGKVLDHNMNQDSTNYFTIEKYFAGEYMGVKPDPNFPYYPEYALPTAEQRKYMLHYSDSLTIAALAHRKDKRYQNSLAGLIVVNAKRVKPIDSKVKCEPTLPVTPYSKCRRARGRTLFYHMRGNVGEWGDEEGIAYGGGWRDCREELLKSDEYRVLKVNDYTGFRCICSWKKREL